MKSRIRHVFPAVLALVLAVGGVAVAANLARGPSPDLPITLAGGSDDPASDDDSGRRASDASDDRLSGDTPWTATDDTPSGPSDDDPATAVTLAEDRPPRTEVREKDGRREVRREVEHDGTDTYPVAAAGHVTVTRDGASLTVDGADAASGWSHRIDRASGREIEVTFRRNGQRVDFKAEIEGTFVKVRVREREA